MTPSFEVLFTLTLYRDGQLRIDGHGRKDQMPHILRTIATAIESGATLLTEADEPWSDD